MNKVFNNLRNKLAEVQNPPEFAMGVYRTNMLMWSWFLIHRWKQRYFWVWSTLSICLSWTRSTLLNHRATQLIKAKVSVCTDSALCFLQGKQLNSGKAKWQLFKWKIPSMSYLEWMENQLNWNGQFPRIHRIGDSLPNSMRFGEFPHRTGNKQWSNPLYVHVQRHRHLQDRIWGCLYLDFLQSSTICIKICERTLGIHWTRKRSKVV